MNYNQLVIIDLDKTLTKIDTLKSFSLYALKKGEIKFLSFIPLAFLLKFKIINNITFKKVFAKFCLKNYNYEKIDKLSKKWFEDIGKNLIRKNFQKKFLKEKNYYILLSANFDFIVKIFYEFLKFDEFISIKLEVKNGNYTGKVVGMIPYGENKLKILLEKFPDEVVRNATAFGDDESDLMLLNYVKNGILIK